MHVLNGQVRPLVGNDRSITSDIAAAEKAGTLRRVAVPAAAQLERGDQLVPTRR